MTETAMRFNKNKPQLSYILEAQYALEGLAEVMMKGAQKYERSNWRKPFPMEELVDSLTRHLVKYMSGEEFDDESGCHHLDHVLANSIFLSYHFNGRKPKDE
jgi:hypothetical protein